MIKLRYTFEFDTAFESMEEAKTHIVKIDKDNLNNILNEMSEFDGKVKAEMKYYHKN